MYLKRIELQGFKSFADKTVIDVHQGITGIVGPNGSGKSNISDAIRWVLGEQSAKTLRGGKMEDVIFNGTQKRRPLGYAEVSMVFDNGTGFLPSEYAEVEITRRIFRSGESEYMINRSPCRLRDIHELFMDTGMGRDGYSIVGQGKIAEIVSQKSEERRGVFEEAAGISKYRYRKQEAERKLAHTEDNLVRVRDVLAELETRVEPLRRQSEKAIQFLNLREELKGIEVSALLEIIDTKRAQAAEAEEKFKLAEEQLEDIKARHGEANARSEALYESIRLKDSEIDGVREELSRAEAEAAAVDGERTVIENNIGNTRENLIRARLELENWTKRDEGIKAGLEAENLEKTRLEDLLVRREAELDELEGRLREASGEMAVRNNALEQARGEAAELERKKAEAKTRMEGIETLKQTYEERRGAIDGEIAAAKGEAAGYSADSEKLEKEREAAAGERETLAARLEEGTAGAARLAGEIQDRKDRHNSAVSALGEKRARLNMLKDMERSLEGYARSVRELVSDHAGGKYRGAMIGVLSKLIKTEKDYITAVEVALGGAMQNIVVKNEADAKEAIEYLKKNRMGRVTFLPLTTQQGRRLEDEARVLSSRGAVAVAADLVSCAPELRGVVESLLGRTLVADNMDNAAKIARDNKYRFKIVTLEGELLQPGGSITGGSINKSQALLRRGEEIESLEKECNGLASTADRLDDEIEKLTEELAALRTELDGLREDLTEADRRLSELGAAAEMKRSLLRVTEERVLKLEEEKEGMALRSLNADKEKEELSGIIHGSGGLEEEAERLVASRQAALDLSVSEREKASQSVIDKRLEIVGVKKDIEVSQSRLDELRTRLDSSASDYRALTASAAEYEKRIADLETELKNNRLVAETVAETVNGLKDRINGGLADKTGANRELDGIRGEIKELSDSMFAAQEETVRLETKKSRLESDYENASNRLWDDYELTYNTALPYKKDIGSITAANKRIGELKGKIKALGNINVDSIEEYKDVKQRYEFMSTQVTDLEEGKKNLEKLISEMMTVMRSQFREKFEMINKSFGEIFAELFGGGHAGVRLADPDDVLESGIEIEVQPPGKKLQSISLFSGGEHAMTAIALLFALLKATPSPFIVLDEIEAALDDENVYRFADYIRNYDKNTQFVLITHRRGTMEAADILYGVTMQEKGVSRLLAMNLDEIASEDYE